MNIPSLKDVQDAHRRISPFINRTPVLTSTQLNLIIKADLFFKCENFQKVGAFKFRGAVNAVLNMSDADCRHGVVTHSSGNHAAALALAAARRGVKAYIVMPETAPSVKKSAVSGYGAEITFCKPTLQAREEAAQMIIDRTGAILIHAYDNYHVICGQGTASVELIEEIPELDIIITPVGGGGLLSGTAVAVKGLNDSIMVIGAEPKNADDAYRSFTTGILVPSVNPQTVADGLLTSLSERTFSIIRQKADEIITVSEEAIIEAMLLIWERMKIIVEPSAATVFAVLLENISRFAGKRIGLIISGGNLDFRKLPF